MTGALDVVTCLLFAGVLWPLGVWGRSHANELIPGNLPEDERDHREAVLRRGSFTMQAVSLLFLVGAVGLMFS